MSASSIYFERTMALLERLQETRRPRSSKLPISARAVSPAGGWFSLRSRALPMLCEEMTPRQGCFPGFVALVEMALSTHFSIVGPNGLRPPLYLRKYEGYAEEILKGFKFGANDAFIIISTSGSPRHR